MICVDTNVLVDVFSDDPSWFDWSAAQLNRWALRGPLLIGEVVYAELSVRFVSVAALDEALHRADVTVVPLPKDALFIAGRAFARYRRAGGTRTGVLPDFFIGAHAAAAGLPLLTRDPRRYRSYFPKVELIAPA